MPGSLARSRFELAWGLSNSSCGQNILLGSFVGLQKPISRVDKRREDRGPGTAEALAPSSVGCGVHRSIACYQSYIEENTSRRVASVASRREVHLCPIGASPLVFSTNSIFTDLSILGCAPKNLRAACAVQDRCRHVRPPDLQGHLH